METNNNSNSITIILIQKSRHFIINYDLQIVITGTKFTEVNILVLEIDEKNDMAFIFCMR